MKRILVTFAGGRLAHGVISALRASGEPLHIIGIDANDYYIHQADADEKHIVPRGDSPDYLPVLADIIEKTQPDFLWPLHEAEMLFAASNPVPGVRMFLPSADVIRVCQDKSQSYTKFKSAGVPAPESVLVEDRDGLEKAFEAFGGDIWLRAIRGTGGTGALAVNNVAQAVSWLDLHDGWGSFTAAERLSGGTYCWESVWKHGELIACQVRTRIIHAVPGTPGGASYPRSVYVADAPKAVEETSIRAVKAVMPAPHGILSVDLTGDANDQPKVTEINAGRFTSSGVVYWHQYGPNFAEIALKAGMDEDPGIAPPLTDPMPKDLYKIMGINAGPTFVWAKDYDATLADYKSRLARLESEKLQAEPT